MVIIPLINEPQYLEWPDIVESTREVKLLKVLSFLYEEHLHNIVEIYRNVGMDFEPEYLQEEYIELPSIRQLSIYLEIPEDLTEQYIKKLSLEQIELIDVSPKHFVMYRVTHIKLKRSIDYFAVTKQHKNFVYVMKVHNSGAYKIGFSNNPFKREKTLQHEKPEIELFMTVPGTYQLEKFFHKMFKSKNLRGEWFNLDNDDLEKLKVYGFRTVSESNYLAFIKP